MKMFVPLCNQTVNLETDAKTLYYSFKLVVQSFYIFKAKKLKQICIFEQQPQKSHEQDILPKNLQIDQLFFASCGMHFMNYFASGMQDAEIQNPWLIKTYQEESAVNFP